MTLKSLIEKHKIIGVSAHSKLIKENYAFVAIKGEKSDGNEFIEQARISGATLIFSEDLNRVNNEDIFYAENPRKALAEISAIIYSDIPENLIGITGTNGKSSIVHFIAQLISLSREKAATIGTLGTYVYENGNARKLEFDTSLTTYTPDELGRILIYLKQSGINYCAIEASSIGLHQYRLWGRKFKVAGFSSFSQDHLDYHKSLENYLDAKLDLFRYYLDQKGKAVINSDIAEFRHIKDEIQKCGIKVISCGRDGDYKYNVISLSHEGQKILLKLPQDNYDIKIELGILGSYQVSNISLAVAMLISIGFKIGELSNNLSQLTAPAGRLERVSYKGSGANIFIDYAHSPDALENVLKELKHLTANNRLILVFGCGGDRDKAKRPIMGMIAEKYANLIIITDDNPRTENPKTIRNEIANSILNKDIVHIIPNREEAIKFAISSTTNKDIILIAGKGHEEYQIVGTKTLPFSDKKIALKYCSKLDTVLP